MPVLYLAGTTVSGGGDSMADALTAAAAILNAGWGFISANPVLFGICAVGVLTAGIHSVKSLF